jgi:phosphomannomutase
LSTEFKEGYEYVVDAEFGWKVIPQDIQKACTLLAADIASDSMKYINKYIESFDNQEFKIRFAKGFTNGTGNMVVDRILKKYNNMFGKIGVL